MECYKYDKVYLNIELLSTSSNLTLQRFFILYFKYKFYNQKSSNLFYVQLKSYYKNKHTYKNKKIILLE